MSITYPLALPDHFLFAGRNWRKHDVTADVPSPFTGQSQVISWPGQWFAATLTLKAMKRAEAQQWEAWLGALKGHQGTFEIGDPLRRLPLGAAAQTPGTPLVKGAGQTGGTLAIDGCPNNVTGYLLAGDLFEVTCSSVKRLHEVLQDVNTNGSGEATIDIWPDLRASPNDNAAIVLTSPKGTFHRTSNMTEWQVGRDGVARRSFDIKERLT